MKFSQSPDQAQPVTSQSPEQVTPKQAWYMGLGALGTAAAVSLALIAANKQPGLPVPQEDSQPIPMKVLEHDPQVPVTAAPNEGADDLIATFEKHVLKGNPDIKREVEKYIERQSSTGIVQPGKYKVPDVFDQEPPKTPSQQ